MLTPGIITNQKTTMTIQKNVAGYWDTRAEGYSLRTIDEIKSPKGEAWVKLIKELLTLPAGSAVADMGCGAGFLALAAARAGLTATGFDVSEGMLEEARANAEALRLTVRFQKADITQTHCPDRSFDAVLSRNAVWNLPAPEAALREWFRILKPGGKLLYADGNHYRYLDDPLWLAAKEKADHSYGHAKQFVLGVDTSPMEAIAKTLPLTRVSRPGWDTETLLAAGFGRVTVLEPQCLTVTDPTSGAPRTLITDFLVLAQKPL